MTELKRPQTMRSFVSGAAIIGLLFCAASLQLNIPAGARSGIDATLARNYFREAQTLSDHDAGKLWGVRLYGPILFADRETRMIIANQADAEGKLTSTDGVFTGKAADDLNFANTATTWAGVKWTMIIWPLPEDRRERLQLIAHELFHRVQKDIGLEANNPTNRHLETRDGRTWLRLEWRALARALQESGATQRLHIDDALYFRRHRQALFSATSAEELALETNEGLAEYTGARLSARSDAELRTRAGYALQQALLRPSFARSFAYLSGPAYGSLLDTFAPNWRRGRRAGDDLGAVLARALKLKLQKPQAEEAAVRARRYDGDEVIAQESRREREREERAAEYRTRLIDGPLVIFPVSDRFSYSFNPNNVFPLDDRAVVYPTIRVSDSWGVLEVSRGALLLREDGRVTRLQVSAPADPQARPLSGEGWTLALAPGWTLVPGPRAGDFALRSPSASTTR
jgi:hypothetical protein